MFKRFNQRRSLIITIIIFGMIIFVSCEKEKKNFTIDKELNVTLFDQLVSQQRFKTTDLITIDEFSESLNALNVDEIIIKEIEQSEISFEVSAGLLFVNSEEFDLDKSEFSIEKQDGVFVISKESSLIGIMYNTVTNEFFVNQDGNTISVEELTESEISAELEKEFITQITILNEFVTGNLVIVDNTTDALNSIDYDYNSRVGSGIGFHLGLADAKYFCKASYDQILSEHSGWWSPGISYSCLFGEHYCMCTATFYN